LLADPDSGLIDGDPGLVQDAIHKERDWFASVGDRIFGTDRSRKTAQHLLPSICFISHRSAATGLFLIGHYLKDIEVHLGMRFYTGDFTGDLGPVPILMEVAFGATAESASLRLIVSSDRISTNQ
jgi:hypothetical protein